jgi:hypothetical protein
MKKFIGLFVFLMVICVSVLVMSAPSDSSSAPFVSKYGSSMLNDSMISYGRTPGDTAGDAIPCTAHAVITRGDVVIMVAPDANLTGYLVCVSKTVTAYDSTVFGVALTTVTAVGQTVYVRKHGICLVKGALSPVAGQRYVTSATAGAVTSTAITGETLLTGLSATAIMIQAVESKTFAAGAGGGYFLGSVGK